ncbi:SPFH domain-containing protein [Bdellovibrio sp. HCB337]|uniref:SPFH domain-containing protein n=1 Tax=Bdellovibrio sp. HCB337 TaxID=3394358 RepID=UPI0039A4704D
MSNQSLLFKGIYEFEDPSGALVAAKVPAVGSVDLYSGTTIVVRPNQCAIFIYKGEIADMFLAGTHTVQTENMPILTRLANWKFGFESPLRCELVFLSGQAFTTRRWGTPQPVLANFSDLGSVPIRAFGNFNVVLTNPKNFYTKLMGTRTTFSISDIEDFLQGQIVELLPEVLSEVKNLNDLATSYNALSKKLEAAVKKEIDEYGLGVQKIQILSALPSKEVLEAMEAKTAIQIIGSQKEYLLYKAATSLGQANDTQGNDPLQMMMGMMLGKGLLGADYHEKEKVVAEVGTSSGCRHCGEALQGDARFCSHCGRRNS